MDLRGVITNNSKTSRKKRIDYYDLEQRNKPIHHHSNLGSFVIHKLPSENSLIEKSRKKDVKTYSVEASTKQRPSPTINTREARMDRWEMNREANVRFVQKKKAFDRICKMTMEESSKALRKKNQVKANKVNVSEKSQRPCRTGPVPRKINVDDGINQFQMMDITVTVLGLSGILIDKNKGRKNSNGPISGTTISNSEVSTVNSNSSPTSVDKFPVKFITTTPSDHFSSNQSNGVSAMSMNTSLYSQRGYDELPVFAHVSFTRNTLKNSTSISTHIPSLPLKDPVCKGNGVSRYTAIWPAKKAHVNVDDIDRSSVNFTRILQREQARAYSSARKVTRRPYDSHDCGTSISSKTEDEPPNFMPELVKLQVGLLSGGEMITLGHTTLVIVGEMSSVEFNLPLQRLESGGDRESNSTSLQSTPGSRDSAGKKIPRTRSFFSRKKKTPACSFARDPKKKYLIDENATLRVMLTVVPHNTDGIAVDFTALGITPFGEPLNSIRSHLDDDSTVGSDDIIERVESLDHSCSVDDSGCVEVEISPMCLCTNGFFR